MMTQEQPSPEWRPVVSTGEVLALETLGDRETVRVERQGRIYEGFVDGIAPHYLEAPLPIHFSGRVLIDEEPTGGQFPVWVKAGDLFTQRGRGELLERALAVSQDSTLGEYHRSAWTLR